MHPDAPESEHGLTRRARRIDASAPVAEAAAPAAEAFETRAARRRRLMSAEIPVELVAVADASLGAVSVVPAAARDSETAAAPNDIDAFEAAARLFSFTGEIPVVAPVAAETASEPDVERDAVADVPTAHRAPRRVRRAHRSGAGVRRVAAAGFSVGVMAVVGLLTVAVTAPAEAVAAATQSESVTSIVASDDADADTEEIQAFVAPESSDTELNRDETYSTATFSEIAAATGITRHTDFFVNDPSAEIQWPFAVGVPISDGYGPRWGSFHYGLDFTPGEGAEIQAVAAGTVRIANETGGAFGVHVMIDHEINGEVFTTHYAHMQYGSLKVQAGDVVEAGTVLGLVGDTGLSYGAHLHFEVYVDGARIDPLPWLREHAGG